MVDDFVEEFDMIASQILGITDEQYLGLFMGRLDEEIRMDVQILDPSTRYKAISMARNVERKLIKFGVLCTPSAVRKGHNFQRSYVKENIHSNAGTHSGNSSFRVTKNNGNPVNKTDKIEDNRKGGAPRGVRNLSY